MKNMDELECAVLGACLIDKNAVPVVLDLIPEPELFVNLANKAVFKAIVELYNSGKGIDYLTVTELLKTKKNDKLVTYSYLSSLTSNIFSAAHIEEHCLILRQEYIRRELERESLLTAQSCRDDSNDALELISEHEQKIQRITNFTQIERGKTVSEIVERMLKRKKSENGVELRPTYGFFKKFNNSDLIILAARPSMGKTALALQLAKEIADDGYPVGFLSLEMSDSSLVMRMISMETAIPFDAIHNQEIHPNQEQAYRSGYNSISQLPIVIDDSAGMTDSQMKAKVSRMVTRNNIRILFVDYLQLMASKAGSREQEISQISRALKAVAKKYEIPVVALSQLSRRLEERSDKRPLLSDLRESGAIEQDADVVIFLHRPEYYGIVTTDRHENTHGLAELIVAKNRNGKLGTVDLFFHGNRFMFSKFENRNSGFDYVL